MPVTTRQRSFSGDVVFQKKKWKVKLQTADDIVCSSVSNIFAHFTGGIFELQTNGSIVSFYDSSSNTDYIIQSIIQTHIEDAM